MSWALKVEGLHKVFCHYNRPLDRLKELATFGLRTYHDELVALEDINIEIEAGSTVGIIGRNGAGKSTLLKIVSGNLGQTSGKVQVRGRLSSILELGIGFQPGLTGRQNIRINALLLGMRPDEIERCIDGCGFPVFRLPLEMMALLFAKLAQGRDHHLARIRDRLVGVLWAFDR